VRFFPDACGSVSSGGLFSGLFGSWLKVMTSCLLFDDRIMAFHPCMLYELQQKERNVCMMNSLEKKDESIDQVTSLPDFYEDFHPEDFDEIFFTESVQRDRSIHHLNIFFFTWC
jgi:hypothetical protein